MCTLCVCECGNNNSEMPLPKTEMLATPTGGGDGGVDSDRMHSAGQAPRLLRLKFHAGSAKKYILLSATQMEMSKKNRDNNNKSNNNK